MLFVIRTSGRYENISLVNSSEDTAIISAQLPVALRDRLYQLAREHDRSASAEIRRGSQPTST